MPFVLRPQAEDDAPIPLWKAKWKCKSPWVFMAGITAQSPAKGLGAFDPGLDPGEEWAKGGVRLRGPSPWNGEGPERQIERSAWLRQRNAKDPKGKSSVPPGSASGTRKGSPSPFRRQSLSAVCALRRRRKDPSIAEFGSIAECGPSARRGSNMRVRGRPLRSAALSARRWSLRAAPSNGWLREPVVTGCVEAPKQAMNGRTMPTRRNKRRAPCGAAA